MAVAKIRFFSKALGMCVTCDVILPQRKDPADQRPFPVLWLLHGMRGSHSSWLRQTNVERYLAPYGVAAVMPSAQNSFYTDMAHGGKFYTFIAEELPETMGKFFNFSRKREDNYIAGLSMGGCGSLMIGLSKPENYAAIGCFSAGDSTQIVGPMGEKLPHIKALTFGDAPVSETYKDTLGNARKILDRQLPQPRIYHSCGTEDSLLIWAHATRDFFLSLPDNAFQYQYFEGPGAHNWDFWDQEIQKFIQFLHLPGCQSQFV